MALSLNPAGYIEPAIIENWLEISRERGIPLDELADQVAPESEHLAAVLRERYAAATARAVATPDAPKGRRSARTDEVA